MGETSSARAHDIASNRGNGRSCITQTRSRGNQEQRASSRTIPECAELVYKVGAEKVQTLARTDEGGFMNHEWDNSDRSFIFQPSSDNHGPRVTRRWAFAFKSLPLAADP